jgi:hypothetical protein
MPKPKKYTLSRRMSKLSSAFQTCCQPVKELLDAFKAGIKVI